MIYPPSTLVLSRAEGASRRTRRRTNRMIPLTLEGRRGEIRGRRKRLSRRLGRRQAAFLDGVAGDEAGRAHAQRGGLDAAALGGMGTARVEGTAGRRGQRARHLAG